MKQQQLQKQVDKLTKVNSNLEKELIKQQYIIRKLEEELLLVSPENQVKLDLIKKEAKKTETMSKEELSMFSLKTFLKETND